MLSISEVSARSGLRPSALRYYEEAGLLPTAARVAGRRHYDATVLARLRVIACAKSAGFTIAEIRQLLTGDDRGAEQWRPLAVTKLREIDTVIEKALAMRRLLEESLACECASLEDCSTLTNRSGRVGGPAHVVA
ncbi:MerR family transcriptional regulator [soil metagenome]